MSNIEKYNEAFQNAFGLKSGEEATAVYQEISTWDSIGHMNLMAQIEDAFDIMLDTDDLINFSSYVKGMEILKKYDVEF